jgi:hypothetical protein
MFLTIPENEKFNDPLVSTLPNFEKLNDLLFLAINSKMLKS